jgi:hypothetical protein
MSACPAVCIGFQKVGGIAMTGKYHVTCSICDDGVGLGCLFLQESSGFLFFLLLWHFFQRNHDSCSAVTFLEPPQETCLSGVYVESYVGYQFVRQKQSMIQFYGILQWLLSTTIAAPPPPLLRRHHCAATTTATPLAARRQQRQR